MRTCVFCVYVHFMNHTYAYLRNDCKINFRMVSVQHFIKEAPEERERSGYMRNQYLAQKSNEPKNRLLTCKYLKGLINNYY